MENKLYQINSIIGQKVIYKTQAQSMKEAIEIAVKNGVDLGGANLDGTDLVGANLASAKLGGASLKNADLTQI